MALTYRTFFTSCHYMRNITKPVKWSVDKNSPMGLLSHNCYGRNVHYTCRIFNASESYRPFTNSFRQCSTKPTNNTIHPNATEPPKKEGMIQKLKVMYRDYWYVVVPVHFITSAMWFGSFYYAVRSGVDVVSLLESIGISDTLLKPIRESSAGYFALAFTVYKLVTPLRYTVTIGVTTVAIKRLTAMGWIKPVPSKQRIKEMIQEKKDNFQDRKQHYQSQMKVRSNKVMDEMRRYKQDIKDKVKKM